MTWAEAAVWVVGLFVGGSVAVGAMITYYEVERLRHRLPDVPKLSRADYELEEIDKTTAENWQDR